MMIAPKAALDDGAFDVVGIETTVRDSLRLTAKIYAGAHVGEPGVTSQRGTVVRAEPVDPSDHVLLDVDGEAPGRLPATFTIRPGAIQIRG
jgi:diacylglycerol kinase family enzyme